MKNLLKKCTILSQRQQYINLAKLKSGGCIAVDTVLGPVQTPNFSWAEPNSN